MLLSNNKFKCVPSKFQLTIRKISTQWKTLTEVSIINFGFYFKSIWRKITNLPTNSSNMLIGSDKSTQRMGIGLGRFTKSNNKVNDLYRNTFHRLIRLKSIIKRIIIPNVEQSSLRCVHFNVFLSDTTKKTFMTLRLKVRWFGEFFGDIKGGWWKFK